MSASRKTDLEIIGPAKELETPTRWMSLRTLTDVRTEMSRVYREARTGKLAVADAARLTFILDRIARIIESGELARRVELLELIMSERK